MQYTLLCIASDYYLQSPNDQDSVWTVNFVVCHLFEHHLYTCTLQITLPHVVSEQGMDHTTLLALLEALEKIEESFKSREQASIPDCNLVLNLASGVSNRNVGMCCSWGRFKVFRTKGLPSGASSKGAPRGVQDALYSLDIASSSPGYSFAD
ncbi:UNVERIFIED_CONTAM: hypothetical protein FKN15_066607 [Acipenser sinensis]